MSQLGRNEILGMMICEKRTRARLSKHDEGNADTCDLQALGSGLIGSDDAGVDELDRNGRSLNRPVLLQGVFQIRVCDKGARRKWRLVTILRRIAEVCSKNAAAIRSYPSI